MSNNNSKPVREQKAYSILNGKKVCIILTGTIGSIKGFDLCRELVRLGASVYFVVSQACRQLISKQALEWASCNEVFDSIDSRVKYLWLGQECDIFVVFASADFISKLSLGISDDISLLTASVALSSGKKILILPLMHKQLFTPIISKRLEELASLRVILLKPHEEADKLKVPRISDLVFEIEKGVSEQSLVGKRIVISVGKTSEKIDDVRVMTNNATGKFGAALAREFCRRGALVNVIASECKLELPNSITVTEVSGYEQLRKAIIEKTAGADLYISTVAVCDFKIGSINVIGSKAHANQKKLSSSREYSISLTPREKLLSVSKASKTIAFSLGEKPKKLQADLTVFLSLSENEPGSELASIEFFKGGRKVGKKIKGAKEAISKSVVDFIIRHVLE